MNPAARFDSLPEISRLTVIRRTVAHEAPLTPSHGAHHPFLLTQPGENRGTIERADLALPRLRNAGGDLSLGGHVHLAYSGVASGMVVAQTGTSLSSRLKGESSSYNPIRAFPTNQTSTCDGVTTLRILNITQNKRVICANEELERRAICRNGCEN